MTRILFCLLILSTLLNGCATSSGDKKTSAALRLRIGTAHLQQGNYPQALAELLTAVELDPNSPIIHNNLALAYYVREKYVEAEHHLQTALELEPKYTDARNNLGRVYISLKKYDEAITELTATTQDLTYPSPEKAYSNLALAYYKKGDYAKAKETSLAALKADKSFCPAQSTYNLSLFFLEDYKRAASSFEKTANQCDKEKEEAHYYSGLSYYKLGSKEKATARLQEVISLFPEGEYAEKAKNMLTIIK